MPTPIHDLDHVPKAPSPSLVTPEEAATAFVISPKLVHLMIDYGVITHLRVGDTKWVSPVEVFKALEARERSDRDRAARRGLLGAYPDLAAVAARLGDAWLSTVGDAWVAVPDLLARAIDDHEKLSEAATFDETVPLTLLECLCVLQTRDMERGLDAVDRLPHSRAIGNVLADLHRNGEGLAYRVLRTEARNPRLWKVVPA